MGKVIRELLSHIDNEPLQFVSIILQKYFL